MMCLFYFLIAEYKCLKNINLIIIPFKFESNKIKKYLHLLKYRK